MTRRALIAAGFVLILLAVFIVLLPEAARRLAVHRLERALAVPVRIDDVDIDLFRGRAAAESLVIGDREDRPILAVPLVSIEFSPLAAITGRIDLHRIDIEGARLLLERIGPSEYNLTGAIRADRQTEQQGSRMPSFAIRDLRIRGGEIVFVDHTRQPNTTLTLSALDLAAGPISSVSGEVAPTEFSAAVQVAGGIIRLGGSSTLFARARRTELRAEIEKVRLSQFGAYLPYGGRLELAESVLDGNLSYELALQDGKAARHELRAALYVGALTLTDTQAEKPPLARIAGASAREIVFDFLRHRMRIGALIIDKPYLRVRRDATGFNLSRLAPAGNEPSGSPASEKAPPLPVAIDRFEARGGTVEFLDKTVAPAVKAVVQGVAGAAREISLAPDFSLGAMDLTGQLGSGMLALAGEFDGAPLQGEFSIDGKNLPFEPFRGYLDRLFTTATLDGESLGASLRISLSPTEQAAVATSITGKMQGRNVALRFPDANEPFLTSERLEIALGTIRAGSAPLVEIEQIALRHPQLRVVRSQQGDLNLTRLWAPQGEEGSAPEKRQGETGTTVAIRSITVNEGEIEIRDRSVSPDYTTTVSQLKGSLTNLAAGAKRAQLNLKGRLERDADVDLSGWFTPFSERPRVQLKASIRSYALPPLNPYTTQYLSHRIRRGQITTEIDYALKGEELQASAGLVLRDLRLGEKTGDEFAHRIGIPLELAIALLQDVSGVIRLQLAMTSETGPRLDIAGLIWTAVRNAIVRAITAPFRLVGNILTLGGRIGELRIDPITFEPGMDELEPKGEKQLEQLAALLKEKPRLQLKLSGRVSQSELDAIRQRRFWEEIESAKGKNYQQALIALYRELGGVTEPGLPLASRQEESMERFVMARLDLSAEEQNQLARARAQVVERELQARGIDSGRLAVSRAENPVGAEQPSVQIDIVS